MKDQILTLLKQRHDGYKAALEKEKDPRSKHAVDLIARMREDSQLMEVVDSLPDDHFREPTKRLIVEDEGHLTWQDIKKIVNIADALLDDSKMRMAIQNHSEEDYYQRVLKEYNKD